MKVLAICIKSYIDEDALREFLDGKKRSLNVYNLFRKGQEYYVVEKYYNKKYFKLVENL